MSELDQIHHLRSEIRRDRMAALRFWVIFLTWVTLYVIPQFKSIFNSMNVELPCTTRIVLAASDILQDWWFLALPALWIAWRLVEDRVLSRLTLASLGTAARMGVVAAVLIGMALMSPMLKLINNVG